MNTGKKPLRIVDIGVNLTDRRLAKSTDLILDRARSVGVEHVIAVGTSIDESGAALQLALEYPGVVSCTAGTHPHVARNWSTSSTTALKQLCTQEPVVAVGECGLDFNRDFSPRDQQEQCFAEQLTLAAEVAKPVFLHERDAHERFRGILAEQRDSLKGAVVHCFTGTKTELRAYLDLDCHIGITGWLCDERRGDELREAVRFIPLDRLVLETDAPYLTPRNIRPRPKYNEPAFLPHILHAISELREESEESIASATTENAMRFFNLKI